MERHEGGYYIRLMARDLAGTAATIATRLAEQKISLESIVQRHPEGVDANGATKKASPVPVILITYATQRGRGLSRAGGGAARQGDQRPAAGDPDRKELARDPDGSRAERLIAGRPGPRRILKE